MRKYLTVDQRQSMAHGMFGYARPGSRERTVVDLLQCDDRVCWQALLRVLVEQEGLWSHRPLLRRWHRRLAVVRVHSSERLLVAKRRGAGAAIARRFGMR